MIMKAILTKVFGLPAALSTTILLLGGFHGSASAADPEFCREYARTAVEQFREAEHRESCNHLLGRGGWSGDFRAHFEWCRGANRETAWHERESRNRHLDECSHRREWREHEDRRDYRR